MRFTAFTASHAAVLRLGEGLSPNGLDDFCGGGIANDCSIRVDPRFIRVNPRQRVFLTRINADSRG